MGNLGDHLIFKVIAGFAVIVGALASVFEITNHLGEDAGSDTVVASVGFASKEEVAQMRGPIDRIFTAWESKDLSLYMGQWTLDTQQFTPNDTRDYQALYERRQRNFEEFSLVDVEDYTVCYYGPHDGKHMLFVTYSMRYEYHDAAKEGYAERDIKESYGVVFNPNLGRWMIKENRDYIGAAPC